MRGRLVAVLMASVAAVLAACTTIPPDEEATVVAEGVPSELVVGDQTTTTIGEGPTRVTEIWLVLALEGGDPELLTCPVRVTAESDPNEQAQAVLDRLISIRPSTSTECSELLTNAVPADLVLLDTSLEGGILDVDLAGLGQIEAENQRLAVAQIVFTATELSGVSQVRFLLNGQYTAVPTGDRTADPGSGVSRIDFPRFTPLPSTTTTAAPPPPLLPDPEAPGP